MVTTAHYINNMIGSFTDKLEIADKASIKSEQDYEKEETLFTFEDDSQLLFSAMEFSILIGQPSNILFTLKEQPK